jgi:hypothetical protein
MKINYEMIDLLEKTIDTNIEADLAMLKAKGFLSSDGQIEKNKLNLMTGAYVVDLMDTIIEADLNAQEVIVHIETLYIGNQFMAIFYFLLYLFAALDMQFPYLFIVFPRQVDALDFYISAHLDVWRAVFYTNN